MEVIEDNSDPFADQRFGVPSHGPQLLDDLKIGALLQSSHEEAPVLVDAGDAVELEVTQVEQQQPAL